MKVSVVLHMFVMVSEKRFSPLPSNIFPKRMTKFRFLPIFILHGKKFTSLQDIKIFERLKKTFVQLFLNRCSSSFMSWFILWFAKSMEPLSKPSPIEATVILITRTGGAATASIVVTPAIAIAIVTMMFIVIATIGTGFTTRAIFREDGWKGNKKSIIDFQKNWILFLPSNIRATTRVTNRIVNFCFISPVGFSLDWSILFPYLRGAIYITNFKPQIFTGVITCSQIFYLFEIIKPSLHLRQPERLWKYVFLFLFKENNAKRKIF